MNKKIFMLNLIAILSIIFCSNIFSTENKIVDLKLEIGFGHAFLLPKSDNKDINYGYYEITKSNKTFSIIDKLKPPFKDKVSNKELTNFMAIYNKFLGSAAWMSFSIISSSLLLGISPLFFYQGYTASLESNNTDNFYQIFFYSLGGSFAGIGAVFLISFFILLPFTIINHKKYKEKKINIINTLNSINISHNKIKVSFGIDLYLDNLK